VKGGGPGRARDDVVQGLAGVTDETGLRREPGQGLGHGEGQQFGVGEFRRDLDCRPFGAHCGCLMRGSSMVT
jgi:hypothetical protein